MSRTTGSQFRSLNLSWMSVQTATVSRFLGIRDGSRWVAPKHPAPSSVQFCRSGDKVHKHWTHGESFRSWSICVCATMCAGSKPARHGARGPDGVYTRKASQTAELYSRSNSARFFFPSVEGRAGSMSHAPAAMRTVCRVPAEP